MNSLIFYDKQSLLSSMRDGATIVTPNNRLSNELITDCFNLSAQPVQRKPNCVPYKIFLQNTFKKLTFNGAEFKHPILLTMQQTRYLWRNLLANKYDLRLNDGLLTAIEEAWSYCNLWELDFNHYSFQSTPQTQQFQQWAQSFAQILLKLNLITEEQLTNYFSKHSRYLPIIKTIIWACFDNFTPAQCKLQDLYYELGAECGYYDLTTNSPALNICPNPPKESDLIKQNVCMYAAQDQNEEYQELIVWLQDRLARGEKRIAVIVPDLQGQFKIITRRLQAHIPNTKFNVSLGQNLAAHPLVAHALSWLYFDGKNLDILQARLLLHSPFVRNSYLEMEARFQFMEDHYLLQEGEFTKADFINELKMVAPQLAKLIHILNADPQTASPYIWVRIFKKRLRQIGFPGEYSLNSAAFQYYQRFLLLFDEFLTLTLISPSMTKQEALAAIRDLANGTIFQPQKTSAVVQILGLLEAQGCTFDNLWVMGLTAQLLPQNTRFSALIPIALQRELSLPHTDPVRELAIAQKIVARLQNSSHCSVFSYPQLSGDCQNMPSPLITAFNLRVSSAPSQILPKSSPLIVFTDAYKVPFITAEEVVGGATILANQAKCPFKSFARHRLHAHGVPKIAIGINALERGKIIHKALELLWRVLKTQQNLLHLSTTVLDQEIEQAIVVALKPFIKRKNLWFTSILQEIELLRLRKLIYTSLEWERQRAPFTVSALEENFNVNLANLSLHVRVDRIDLMASGYKMVIDYKSSLPATLPWYEECPTEPQLLLYALLDEMINTIMFIELKAGQLRVKSISGEQELKDDWMVRRKYWQQQLDELAGEFKSGSCEPRPNPSVCKLCDYQNLCRV